MITDSRPPFLQAEDWFDIEPSDRYNFVGDTTKNPDGYTKAALWIGIGGNISIHSAKGKDKIFKNVPSGTFLAVACVRVNATGTTCTDIVGVISETPLTVKQ